MDGMLHHRVVNEDDADSLSQLELNSSELENFCQLNPQMKRSMLRDAGMSRARFAKHFHQVVAVTPFEYLCVWRIGVAQSLLKKGEPLKVVAPSVGLYGFRGADTSLLPARGRLSHRVGCEYAEFAKGLRYNCAGCWLVCFHKERAISCTRTFRIRQINIAGRSLRDVVP